MRKTNTDTPEPTAPKKYFFFNKDWGDGNVYSEEELKKELQCFLDDGHYLSDINCSYGNSYLYEIVGPVDLEIVHIINLETKQP